MSLRIVKMNHGIQVIQALNARFPGIRISTDPPSGAGTSWWYDLEYNGRKATVEWKPERGFGFYKDRPAEESFGVGPDEVFPDFAALLERLGQEFGG